MKGMSLRGSDNIQTTPDDPVPSGFWGTGDWVLGCFAICMFFVILIVLFAL